MASRIEPQASNSFGEGVHTSTATALSDSSTAAKPETVSQQTALAADPFIGRVLSHYRLEERLGAGGMGMLYRATDLKLGRAVAIKLLARHLVSDETAKARFVREARAASALDHPNIANVHEIGEEDGELFIVMALYEGETLKQRLERGRLGVDEAIAILRQVLLALEAAHGAPIVHRDIKPANVLVTRNGAVKILDFGLAKLISGSQAETMTQAGQAMGTILYMSPEQLRSESVDPRSDLWSLGVLTYELLAGVSPFHTDSSAGTVARIINDEPPSLASIPGVPAWLADLVAELLRKKAGERPSSASEVLRRIDESRSKEVATQRAQLSGWRAGLNRLLSQPQFFVTAILVLAAAISWAAWLGVQGSRARQAREQTLPEVSRLAESGRNAAAYRLFRHAQRYIPNDPLLRRYEHDFLWPLSIHSSPPGSEVYIKDYVDPDGDWQLIGTTPLDNVKIPSGNFRWRLMKRGFETLEVAGSSGLGERNFTLAPEGSLPLGMISVPGGNFALGGTNVELKNYFLDKYEVTNRQFKEFVERGGYQKPEYWNNEFTRDGQQVPWEEAMAVFRDATGRPGPAGWELGDYPKEQDEYPVTGVSWYEAAAYANFAGKSLPTVYHWRKAATASAFTDILQFSNFAGKGPARVGSFRGLGPYGTYDMAGNVKEWCWNATGDRRYILGGAWNEDTYMFGINLDALSPWDRSAANGFRTAKFEPGDVLPESVTGPLDPQVRDYTKESPVSDEIFKAYVSFYSYDKHAELKPVVEVLNDRSDYWRKEKITFNAAYGNERVIAYLFLPKNGSPPFQTGVFFPGAGALQARSSENAYREIVNAVVRSGRAMMYPIYKGTYERREGGSGFTTLAAEPQSAAEFRTRFPSVWRDRVIQWGKDLGRSIDYLETRKDIDHDRLFYEGLSLGGTLGAIFPAVDKRFKTSVLISSGFHLVRKLPEADEINFAPRVTIPVLMLNGKDDFLFPVETSQRPMFRLFGAREKDKRHVLFDSGHLGAPRNLLTREVLDWLDRYLGPVKTTGPGPAR